MDSSSAFEIVHPQESHFFNAKKNTKPTNLMVFECAGIKSDLKKTVKGISMT